MAIQVNSRIHVSRGKEDMIKKHTSAPSIGTNGTHGVLNPRIASGSAFRRIMIPTQTMTKASSVPMETNSPKSPIGKRPAKNAAKLPVTMVVICGVLNFEWVFAKLFHNKPSLAIEKNTLDCPKSNTRTTELRPAIAPILIIGRNHIKLGPAVSIASAIGAETFNSL